MDATAPTPRPVHLDLDRARGLEVTWDDGVRSFYPVAHLRRASPSADAKALREEMARNPLTVLPGGRAAGPLTAVVAERGGHYASRLRFSDGPTSGRGGWADLRS
ncbi:MAG: gamma-butyrobetaine hydroxylase-like domain-containing protein, partial [Phycisphaerales bacterium]